FAEVAHFGGAHLGVAGQLGSLEAVQLALTRCLHACADGDRVFGVAFIGQLLVVDTGDFDVDVDAVQQRAADALLVAHDGGGGTAAFSDRVAEEATGTGIHGGHQHEVGGIGNGSLRARYGDHFVFQRLTHDFQDVLPKFG